MDETMLPGPELMGYALDLNRPELREVLDRYFPHIALVVARKPGAEGRLLTALVEDGWKVEVCTGPGKTPCPILRGKGSCHLRRTADVAVVYVDGGEMFPGSGLLPRLLCAVGAESPAVIALEGRFDRASSRTRHAVVGALRDPAEMVEEIRNLVGPDDAPARSGPASP